MSISNAFPSVGQKNKLPIDTCPKKNFISASHLYPEKDSFLNQKQQRNIYSTAIFNPSNQRLQKELRFGGLQLRKDWNRTGSLVSNLTIVNETSKIEEKMIFYRNIKQENSVEILYKLGSQYHDLFHIDIAENKLTYLHPVLKRQIHISSIDRLMLMMGIPDRNHQSFISMLREGMIEFTRNQYPHQNWNWESFTDSLKNSGKSSKEKKEEEQLLDVMAKELRLYRDAKKMALTRFAKITPAIQGSHEMKDKIQAGLQAGIETELKIIVKYIGLLDREIKRLQSGPKSKENKLRANHLENTVKPLFLSWQKIIKDMDENNQYR